MCTQLLGSPNRVIVGWGGPSTPTVGAWDPRRGESGGGQPSSTELIQGLGKDFEHDGGGAMREGADFWGPEDTGV